MFKKIWESKDGTADISNNFGSASLLEKATTLSKADTLELCQLMVDMKLKADAVYLDVHASAKVFMDTFVSDPNCSLQDLRILLMPGSTLKIIKMSYMQ
eukprot:2272287-Ditylum_brightwellii.AAC.1